MSLESEVHESMLNIYRLAKSEANYDAKIFLGMVIDHGGVEAANRLINASHISAGYTALLQKGYLNLTVEAMIVDNEKYHPLFSNEQIKTCIKRLTEYGYYD